jgi:hypothetical protein
MQQGPLWHLYKELMTMAHGKYTGGLYRIQIIQEQWWGWEMKEAVIQEKCQRMSML